MGEHGIIGCNKLGHRVAERGSAADGYILFNDGGLAVFIHQNEIAGVTHDWRRIERRNKKETDRVFHNHATTNVYVGTIFHEGRIQSGEAVPALVEVTPKVLLHGV